MCLTDLVYETAEKGIFPSQKEYTSLTTLRKLKANAGHMTPPYNSAEHEDSKLYRLNPGNVVNQASIEYKESEEKDDETHSAKCISINDGRGKGNSSSGIGDNSEPRISTDETAAAFPTTYDSLMMCQSQNTSRPPMQRRYINPEAASTYKRQHQILLAITERLGLPKGDKRHSRSWKDMRELFIVKED